MAIMAKYCLLHYPSQALARPSMFSRQDCQTSDQSPKKLGVVWRLVFRGWGLGA